MSRVTWPTRASSGALPACASRYAPTWHAVRPPGAAAAMRAQAATAAARSAVSRPPARRRARASKKKTWSPRARERCRVERRRLVQARAAGGNGLLQASAVLAYH